MTAFGSHPTWAWEGLNHAKAAALLASHFPAADHACLKAFGQGDFCLAFKLGRQIVRVARHPEAAIALRREACVLAEVAALLPLPVPRPVYHAPHASPPFTIHDEVVGAVLTRESWEHLPARAWGQAAADLAAFLRALHGLPADFGLRCGLVHLDGPALARSLRAAIRNTIYSLLDCETQRRLDTLLKRWSSSSSPVRRRPALLHCDIAPGHLLYDRQTGSLTGVIDFGDMAIGDPARDFIYLYEDYGLSILTEVLSRYAGEEAPSLLSEIRKWYLLETIVWTTEQYAAQRSTDVEHGLAEIKREIEEGASFLACR